MSNVKKNFVYLSLYKVFELLLPLMVSPLLSRRLGADAMGEFTYLYSIVSLFVIWSQLGVYRYGLREIAKVRNDEQLLNKKYSEIFITHFVHGVFVLGIYIIWALFILKENSWLAILMCGFIISDMLDNAFYYVGFENIKVLTIRDFATKVITFGGISFFVWQPDDLGIYAVIMVLGNLGSKLAANLYALRYLTLVRTSWQAMKMNIVPMATLMIPALAAVVYQSMDKIMLGNMYSVAQVAFYDCASKALIAKNIITSLGTVMCPVIANLMAEGKKYEAREEFCKSLKIALIMAFLFACGIAAVSEDFAPLFWGEPFRPVGSLMAALSICIPFWTVGEVIRNQYLLPAGKDSQYISAFVAGVCVNAICNFMLIPYWGAYGAISATIIAELFMSFLQWYMVKNEVEIFGVMKAVLMYALISLIMYISIKAVVIVLNISLWIKLIVEFLLGAFLYIFLGMLYELKSQNQCLIKLVSSFRRKDCHE